MARARLEKKTVPKSALVAPEASPPPATRRKPINSDYAGKVYPLSPALQQKYGIKGIRFSKDGYPIWPKKVILQQVTIEYTGSRGSDFTAANKKVREEQGDPDWKKSKDEIWHHHEDQKTMQLVPKDLHEEVKHSGGVSSWEADRRDEGHGNLEYGTAEAKTVASSLSSGGAGGGGPPS